MSHILLNTRVQSIYFQTRNNELGIEYSTSDKRITIDEAKNILTDREIECEEVLKVKYEYVELEIPLKQFNQYIIENN